MSSRRISSDIPSRMASRTVCCFIGVPSGQSGDVSTIGAAGAEAAATGAGAASTGAACAGAEATMSSALSPSSRSTAIAAFTLTPSVPSAIKILPMIPSSTASNSIVALSVSISAKMSPDFTVSPSLTNHLAKVPSSIVGESAGIRISVAISISPIMRRCRSTALQELVPGCFLRIQRIHSRPL